MNPLQPGFSVFHNFMLVFLLPMLVGLMLAGEMKGMRLRDKAGLPTFAVVLIWMAEPQSRPYMVLAVKVGWPILAPLVYVLGGLAAVVYVVRYIVRLRMEH